MLARIWVWLKMTLGVETTADLLNYSIRKLITAEVQAQLTALILDMANTELSGSDKKKQVIARFEEIKGTVLGNVKNLQAEMISTAIDLIVNYLHLRGELNYSVPPPK